MRLEPKLSFLIDKNISIKVKDCEVWESKRLLGEGWFISEVAAWVGMVSTSRSFWKETRLVPPGASEADEQ